ncbi:NAD(P)-dependent oxidoreductase [Anaerococcus sp. AGMB09787]|uniref:precorrin-2 dehydrogenase/sirohydrochlorin ferrochelatase family protein n=1 Tax=Anaerococcus sp. AGMB09787 TaxID=2922869 RepID=UPI001FAE86AE|nr:NAD(P)-dependent oxidoreductase [Anaerococcus sp. AGMB09787]
MAKFFPISINSENRKVLIIGGGKSALIKLRTLLKSELFIEMVSMDFLDEIYKIKEENPGRIRLIQREISKDFDCFTCDFLILAIGDSKISTSLKKICKEKKILFLDTSNPLLSDFILNKTMVKNDIVFSVSSNGKAPSLSKYLAEEFENFIEDKDMDQIELLMKLRNKLKNKKSPLVSEIMKEAYLWDKEKLRSYIENI